MALRPSDLHLVSSCSKIQKITLEITGDPEKGVGFPRTQADALHPDNTQLTKTYLVRVSKSVRRIGLSGLLGDQDSQSLMARRPRIVASEHSEGVLY